MRVLITGAGGLVGAELVRAFAPQEVVALTHRDLGITAPRGRRVVRPVRPKVVCNCAVMGVDGC